MYLKEIKTFGFKSFADKITLELGKNISGIVGPNGSGKSNVVDAIRWVLGEQSVKSLRGSDNMFDVIFSGSKSRGALNNASVTLVFDNSDHYLEVPYNEVSIKRSIYRTGENIYYLNGEKCRLKDITDLFADSGASKTSFNIIGQGKIDEIISTKPEDRRVIFEDAAGISKYKKRKEEAIRKLDRTNANLVRLNDITNELANNLDPLKEQSEKASLYLESKEELKDIEIALITSDTERLNIEFKELVIKIDNLTDEIAQISGTSITSDISIEKEKTKLKELENKINIKQEELLELIKNIEKTTSEVNLLKEREKYEVAADETKILIDKLVEEKLEIKTKISELRNFIDIKNKELENISSEAEKTAEEYKNLKYKNNTCDDTINKLKRTVNEIAYKTGRLEDSISNNSALPASVRSILDNHKFTGVHNVIGKLIEVEEKYQTAIEIALSSSINYLVVDTETVAKECINYLKTNNIGRATFFPLNVIKPRYIENEILNILKQEPSFINTGDQLVTYDSKYKNIISNQLGSIIIVNDIDAGTKISKLINHRYKIVTLDGQQINVGGSLTGGNVYRNSNNVIKEKYELDSLKLDHTKSLEKIKTLEEEEEKNNKTLLTLENKLLTLKQNKTSLEDIINIKADQVKEFTQKEISLDSEINRQNAALGNNINKEKENLLTNIYSLREKELSMKKEIDLLKIEKQSVSEYIDHEEEVSKKNSTNLNKKQKELTDLEIRKNRIDVTLDNSLKILNEEYNMTFENAKLKYKLEIDDKLAREKVKALKNKLEEIGIVNLGSIDEYERIKTRYEFLTRQTLDLHNAKNTLIEIISEIDGVMEDKFAKMFGEIRKEFKIVFKDLFKGGNADLKLTNPDNMLETGIEIMATPPGKNLTSISLLSGGEKTFTAISLLFAILNVRPVPFCIFDEVEAALDEVNVESFGNYLSKYKDKTQFIIITHKKKTMEYVDVLYGITMQESGVSRLVSVSLKDIEDKKKEG